MPKEIYISPNDCPCPSCANGQLIYCKTNDPSFTYNEWIDCSRCKWHLRIDIPNDKWQKAIDCVRNIISK